MNEKENVVENENDMSNSETTTHENAQQQTPTLEDQLLEMKDKWLRSVAECENIRKRSIKDKEDALKYGITNFAKDMISITDYLEQALSSMATQEIEENPKLKAFYSGVEMTAKELHNLFDRHGIKKINPEEKKFDPNLHQAMMEVESDDHNEGEIVHIMQNGYTMHERLLRPSMVSVCKKNKS